MWWKGTLLTMLCTVLACMQASGACHHLHSAYLSTVACAPVPRTCCLSVPDRQCWLLNPSSAETMSFTAASDPGSAPLLVEGLCLCTTLFHHNVLSCSNMTATDQGRCLKLHLYLGACRHVDLHAGSNRRDPHLLSHGDVLIWRNSRACHPCPLKSEDACIFFSRHAASMQGLQLCLSWLNKICCMWPLPDAALVPGPLLSAWGAEHGQAPAG